MASTFSDFQYLLCFLACEALSLCSPPFASLFLALAAFYSCPSAGFSPCAITPFSFRRLSFLIFLISFADTFQKIRFPLPCRRFLLSCRLA
jgi:hypothetical protein